MSDDALKQETTPRPSIVALLPHHAGRVARAFVVVLTIAWLIFGTLIVVLRYAVLPNVGDYRDDVERIASRALGETVHIGRIDASWRGLHPSITLESLQIVDAQGGDALMLPAVHATLSWESLAVFQLRLASLEIDAPQLVIRRDAEGQLYVAGFPIRRKATPDNRGLEWLLAQQRIRIRHARLTWHDEFDAGAPREDLVLDDVEFAIERSGWQHRIALHAVPPASLAAPIDVRAVVDHRLFASDLSDPAEWRGEVYADVASGDVLAWRTWVPLPATVDGGRGRARVWLRFSDGNAMAGSFATRLAERTHRPLLASLDRIASITADLALDDVAVRWGMTERSALASIDGRVEASQSKTGQRFTASHMALQPLNGNLVPATDFHIERTLGASPDDESGKASLGAIDIGVSIGLVPDAFIPPLIAEKFSALKPRGILTRMAFEWNGPIAKPKAFTIDAGFERLALDPQAPTAEAIAAASHEIVLSNGLVRKAHRAFGQPGFDNLKGSLHASRSIEQSASGAVHATVDLKSDDATINTPGLFDDPVLRFARLEARVAIDAKDKDMEIKVTKASLENPDLSGTVGLTFRHGPNSGSWNEATQTGRGWIDLDAHLTRAAVERVPRYMPNFIGEKARIYLGKSLLGGKVTDATLRMHGALEKIDLRAMPGALATPYPVSVPDALIAVREGKAAGPTARDLRSPIQDDAIFHAAIKVHDATFLYGPARDPNAPPTVVNGVAQPVVPSVAWPVFEDLDADIVFDQARMVIFGHSTRVFGYRLTDIRAELPALADPSHVLRVVGKGSGPAQDLIRFINESPVARWTKNFTAPTRITGNALFALALDLPLTHPRDASVAGSVQFAGNDLALNAIIPPVKQVDGRMDFTDRGLTIDNITGRALGGPLHVTATTHHDGYIELKADGTLDIAAMQAGVRDDAAAGVSTPMSNAIERAAPWVSGSTRFDIDLRVRSKRVGELANDNSATPEAPVPASEASRPDLLITSNLAGLGIALPEPLAKPPAADWPLRIAISRTPSPASSSAAGGAPPGFDSERIQVSLADRLAVTVTRQRNDDGQLAVSNAAYGVGSTTSQVDGPPEVHVELPRLDVDAWRDVVRKIAATNASAGPAAVPTKAAATAPTNFDNLLPRRASLKTPLLHAVNRDFTNVSLTAERLDSGWQGTVDSDQVAGRLSYTDVSGSAPLRNGVAPVASGRVVARLDRLIIPSPAAGSAPVEQTFNAKAQKDFPAIDLVADRFELRGRSLGRLEVVARNVGDGDDRSWQLDRLGLTMPEARFTASGAWGHARGNNGPDETTHLDFDIAASDVGALMDRFGLVKTIKSGTAKLNGSAGWNGGPSTIDFASMNGRMKLEADKGQFLKADPGIAKLLNILSLQGLARRLRLDFSDVFEAGFAFDTVRADVAVDHGIASTSDFQMKGVQATVSMAGTADLEHETTNLHVVVVPDINAGAASLGVAVINPVIGLATFAAQYLFKDKISQALTFEYNVIGPWKKPEVTKIDRDGKETPVVPRKTATSSN